MGKQQSKSSKSDDVGEVHHSQSSESVDSLPNPSHVRGDRDPSNSSIRQKKKRHGKGSGKSSSTGSSATSKNKNGNLDNFSAKKLEALYERYAYADVDAKDRGPLPSVIGIDGVLLLCEDIEVDPEDIVTLVISMRLHAEEQGSFTKEGFIRGLTDVRVDSIEKMKAMVPQWRAELMDENLFKNVYKFSFRFCTGPSSKVLDLDMSIEMLTMLLGDQFEDTKRFCEFLKVQTTYKVMNSDQWMNYYEFCQTYPQGEFSNYDAYDPWPVMFDEYIEWVKTEWKPKSEIQSPSPDEKGAEEEESTPEEIPSASGDLKKEETKSALSSTLEEEEVHKEKLKKKRKSEKSGSRRSDKEERKKKKKSSSSRDKSQSSKNSSSRSSRSKSKSSSSRIDEFSSSGKSISSSTKKREKKSKDMEKDKKEKDTGLNEKPMTESVTEKTEKSNDDDDDDESEGLVDTSDEASSDSDDFF